MAKNNFGWGARIGLFILFVYSLLFLLKETRWANLITFKQKFVAYGAISTFGLHVLSGIYYIAFIVMNGRYT